MTKNYKNLISYVSGCPSTHNKTVRKSKIGVLVVNLGTPDSADYWGVRKYLSEFLSDRRVIDINPIKWQIILQGAILSIRPQVVAKAYQSIWNKELNESPLLTTTRAQAEKLQKKFDENVDDVVVDFAMRYGNPSIDSKMKALIKAGCRDILVMPLYPQYSATTTATVKDAVNACLKTITHQPNVRILPPYYKKDSYISRLNNSIQKTLQSIDFKPEKIIASYHGIPKRYLMQGDPYPCHCAVTSHLLCEKSGLEITKTFQSIFGREEWVKPYTEATVIEMAKSGIKNIAMIAPAFSTDCLETLEEIQYEIKDAFIENGGEKFAYIPCLNDTEDAIDMYFELAIEEMMGWIAPQKT